MKKLLFLFFGLLCLQVFSQSDNCSSATVITPNASCIYTSGTSAGATQSLPGCVGTADDDVWYQFTATQTSHQITVSPSASYDPVVQLFSGSCSSLVSLYCQDLNNAGQAEVINATGLTVGTVYTFRVYHYFSGSASSTFSVCVSNPPTPPANDACSAAINLTVNSTCSSTAGTSYGATQSYTSSCNGNPDDDVWYKFTANNTQQIITVTPSANMDAVIEVFSGTCGSFTSLDCVDNNATGGTETGTEVGLTPGTTYYVRVFDYWSGNGGFPFSICVTGQATTGDEPCNAINLGSVSSDCNYTTFNNSSATASTGTAPAPSACGGSSPYIGGFSASSHDMWFSVTVPASGNIFITSEPNVTPSRITDGVMALYTGACGSLTQIACNDDHNYPGSSNDNLPYLTATGLTPGSTVYIRYWGYGTSTGNFGLCVSSPTNDACANALYICDLNGYSANTNAYTADRPCNMRGDAEAGPTYTWTPGSVSQGATTFGMGGAWGIGQPYPVPPNTYSFDVTIDNNSWIRFTAAAVSATFSVTVGNCFSNGGIQMQIFSGTACCNYIPVSDFQQSASSFALTANSLTVGQDYYLMVDGWGGDICNYTVTANSGVQFSNITALPSTICYGDSTKLTAPSGASSYVWSPGGQTTQVITVAPPTNMTYSCVVSGVCGNKQTLSKTITVNPLPTILVNSSASQTLSICANTTTTLTATGASTYTWSPTTGLSASTGSVVTITPTSTTNTTYTVTGTNASGCKSKAVITIKGLSLPPLSLTNVHPNTCNNQKDTLIATSATATSYSWSNGANTATITPTITSNSVLTVTVTDVNNCKSSASTTVTVLSLPTVSSNTASTCNGQGAVLTATGASTYTWNPATTLSSATGTTVTATPTVLTTYTLTGTAANGCINTGTTSVSVSPTPTVQINGNVSQTITVCAGTGTTLTASGASSYSWSTGANTAAITVTPTAASSVTYVVTGTNAAGCKNTATITVNGQALPSISLNTTSQSVCNGQTFTLTASSASSLSYTWSTGTTGTGTSLSITPTVTSTTIYTVTALDGGTGCKSTATSTLTMLPLPIISSNTATICNGQSTTLTGNGGISYTWTPAATLSNGGISTGSITASPTTTTNYTITGTGANSCIGINTTTVLVNALPVVTVNSATICAGATSTLAANGATTYSWSTSQTGSSVNVSPNITTSYTVTGTNGNNCKNTAIATVSVTPVPTVNTAPTISPSNCGAATGAITGIGITGTGTLSYTWTNSYGQVVGNTANISNDSAGTYNVHVADANCSANFGPFNITNPGAPGAPTVTSNTTAACVGQSITVNASSGASTPVFGWSGPNGFSSSSPSFTLNPTQVNQSGVYAVTVSSAGCKGPASTITLTIHAPPLVDATSSSNSYCSGSTVNLNGFGASTYTWSGPGSYSSNQQNPQIINSTTLSTGIYTLTATDLNGCENTDTAKVTVNLTPSLSGVSANSNTLCAGQTLQLNSTVSPATASVNWSGPNGFSSVISNPSIPTITPSQSGTYSVTATIGNCSSSTNTLSILINPTPVATASVSSNLACAGSTVTLTSSGGVTYSWSGPNGYSSNQQNNTLSNVAVSATGIYTLTALNNFGCFDTVSISLTVAPSPTITSYGTNAANNTVCQGQSIQLTETHTPPSAVINWTGPNGYASPPQSTTFTPTVTGTYTLTATVGSCQSAGLDTVRITVNPNPVASAGINGSSTVCSGATVIFLGGVSGNTYNWVNATGVSVSTQQNYTITNVPTAASGIYTLSVTNSYSCTSTDTVSLTVNQTPVISSILTNAADNTFCAGQTVQLNATATPSGSPIIWTGPAGFASPPQSTTISNATASQSGTYTATTTVGTCTSVASAITITVNPTPTASATASNSVICSGNTLTLNGTGGGSYNWSGPGGTSSLSTYTLTANTSGTYTLVVTNNFNCKDTVTIPVTVNPTPNAAIATGVKTCTGGTLTLSATGNGTINWYSDAGLTNLVHTGTTYNPPTASGTTDIYYVSVISNNCPSVNSTTVSAGNYNIQTGASANIYTGNAPLAVNFSGMVTGASNPTYSWTLSDNATSSLQNPSHTYTNGGDYVVILTGTDPASLCVDTAMLTIHVIDETILIIPNIFTPNGDGINDGFFLTTKGIKSVEGFIMNRWGQMMFTWQGLDSVWDGKAPNGNLETDGVYFYVIKTTDNKGITQEYKGPLTLVR